MDIRTELKHIGLFAADIEPMGGGCVSEVYLVRLASGEKVIAKLDESGDAGLPVEAFMLEYLAEHSQLPIPAVRHVTEELLLLEYVPGDSRFTDAAERDAANLLAGLHAITAPTYGFPCDTVIGGLRQPNTPTESWLDFFRGQRLLYMANEATRIGRLSHTTMSRIEQLSDHLDYWLFEPERPSLIHGDMWTTNILASKDRITGFLDPAIYFAHNEIELAFTTLFQTFGRAFFDRYKEIRPIEPGFFEERRDIYNLYPLLVHVNLFGGSYVSSVERILGRFGF